MAELDRIKINKSMHLKIFKTSFTANFHGGVVFFAQDLNTLNDPGSILGSISEMMKSAYELGKEDAKKEVKQKYDQFKESFEW